MTSQSKTADFVSPSNKAAPGSKNRPTELVCCRLRAILFRQRGGGNGSLVDDHYRRATVYSPFCENMTSSTKPEVRNMLRCRRRRTEPGPQVTCTENVVKFMHAVFEIMRANIETHTDKQTDGHADRNT